jgi:acyl-CoA synthetase (AMP-forming)/AMP-acid ligase II
MIFNIILICCEQAPNFAYALVSRKFKERLSEGGGGATKLTGSLDLSSLKHMINAAEPVDYNAIMDFYNTFKSFGLSNSVVVPTYGLAEHTVFVCSGGKQVISVSRSALESSRIEIIGEASLLVGGVESPTDGALDDSVQRVVGCGYPGHAKDVQVIITSTGRENEEADSALQPSTDSDSGKDSTMALPEGQVGEVWIASDSKAQGYWNQAELSQHDFHAPIPRNLAAAEVLSSATVGGFLRTGDLGFLLNGELFICGRMKDLIIVRGSNHYPQDIERTAEKQNNGDFIRAGCSAAFSLRGPQHRSTEEVVYVAEVQ